MTLYKDANWLYEKYVVDKLSTRQIASIAGCCQATILCWMNKYNIPITEIGKGNKNSKKISSSVKKLWEDPEYRYRQSLGRKNGWKNDNGNRKRSFLRRCVRHGEKHHNWNKPVLTLYCIHCGLDYLSKYKARKFCSVKCWHNYRKLHKLVAKENNPNWHGGRTAYPATFNAEFKEYIRCRDNYKCMLCSIDEIELDKRLAVHHIDYNKQNTTEANCCALCVSCNLKVNYNRSYWTNYFTEILVR